MGISVRNLNVRGGVVVGPPVTIPSGFQPGDFNFQNVFFDFDTGIDSNTVTFTKSGTLYIQGLPGEQGCIGSICYINTTNTLDFYSSEAQAIANANSLNTGGDGLFLYQPLYAVITVDVNDTMKFSFNNECGAPVDETARIRFRTESFTGTLIDSCEITMIGIV